MRLKWGNCDLNEKKNLSETIIRLEGPSDCNDISRLSQFTYLEGFVSSGLPCNESDSVEETFFRIAGDGSLISSGDLRIDGNAFIEGSYNLKRTFVDASDKIEVRDVATTGFIEVLDDKKEMKNIMFFSGLPPSDGQLLYVKNSDQQNVIGSDLGVIPPSRLGLFVYFDSGGWVGLSSISSHSSSPNNTSTDGGNIMKEGEICFATKGENMIGEKMMLYDPTSQVFTVPKLAINEFVGDRLEFHFASLENAALVNPTIDGLRHLSVESIGLSSHAKGIGSGTRLATIDERGNVSSTSKARWQEKEEELQLTAISSISGSALNVRSNIDLNSNTILNGKFAKGTSLEDIRLLGGIIENADLYNVTGTDFTLRRVVLDSVRVENLSFSSSNVSALLVDDKGALAASASFLEREGIAFIEGRSMFSGPVDFGGNTLTNMIITNGTINATGIQFIVAENDGVDNRDGSGDSESFQELVSIDKKGKIKSSFITLSHDGTIQDLRVNGEIDFRGATLKHKRGSIAHATIRKSHIIDAVGLEVSGKAVMKKGLIAEGDTFIDGDLSVSGTVLGAGPYIDASDKRFKQNVENISGVEMLDKIEKIQGVKYDMVIPAESKLRPSFDRDGWDEVNSFRKKHFGFLAQDVENIFPEIVSTGADGFKGLQYSRFAPILIESMKELKNEVNVLKRDIQGLREQYEILQRKIC